MAETKNIGTVKVDGYEFALQRVQDLDPYKRVVDERFQVVIKARPMIVSRQQLSNAQMLFGRISTQNSPGILSTIHAHLMGV